MPVAVCAFVSWSVLRWAAEIMAQTVLNMHEIRGTCPVCGTDFNRVGILINLTGVEIDITWFIYHEDKQKYCTCNHLAPGADAIRLDGRIAKAREDEALALTSKTSGGRPDEAHEVFGLDEDEAKTSVSREGLRRAGLRLAIAMREGRDRRWAFRWQ